MKIIIFLLINVLFISNIISQVPEKFSYQAVVRDDLGNLIKNQQIGIQVSLIQSDIDGIIIYTETHIPTTNSNGLLTIEIGTGSTPDDFSLIDWTISSYFIKTEIDLNGGINYTLSNTTELLSVPFALYAKTAENVKNIDINGDDTTFEGWDKDASDDFSGDYNELANKPVTITEKQASAIITNTSKVSNVQADWNASIGDAVILNKPNRIENADVADVAKSLVLTSSGGYQYKISVDDEGNILKEIVFDPTKVVDIDGNVYNTVVIGTQTWMAENLKTTTYNDGTQIPNVIDNNSWSAHTSGAYSWYNNDEASYEEPYGALYNGYAVETEKLCPSGWHVPSEPEWTVLLDYMGGMSVAGGKLKIVGVNYWNSPNIGATDEYEFSAYPSGSRDGSNGSFSDIKRLCDYWTSTVPENRCIIRLFSWEEVCYPYCDRVINDGVAVRCIKD